MNIKLSGKITEFYYTVIIDGVELYYLVRWTSHRYDSHIYYCRWVIQISKWGYEGWEIVFHKATDKKRPGNNDSFTELNAFLKNQLSNLKK